MEKSTEHLLNQMAKFILLVLELSVCPLVRGSKPPAAAFCCAIAKSVHMNLIMRKSQMTQIMGLSRRQLAWIHTNKIEQNKNNIIMENKTN